MSSPFSHSPEMSWIQSNSSGGGVAIGGIHFRLDSHKTLLTGFNLRVDEQYATGQNTQPEQLENLS
jgi:hypothetical protein